MKRAWLSPPYRRRRADGSRFVVMKDSAASPENGRARSIIVVQEFVSALGGGGMGEVYRARDANELVEGDDLAHRLAGGPIAIDEALPIAVQITEGSKPHMTSASFIAI